MEGLGKLNKATRALFETPGPGSGKTRVAIAEKDSDGLTISAALAIRGSQLPYAPVLPEDRDGYTLDVSVEFPGMEEPGEPCPETTERVEAITAVITFLDGDLMPDPYRDPEETEAHMVMAGDCEEYIAVRHTPGLDMGHGELAEILQDAYQAGTMLDGAGWDEVKHQAQALAERMEALAAGILGNPAEAFRMSMERHLDRFFVQGVNAPGERVETRMPHRGGTLTLAFEPGPGAG